MEYFNSNKPTYDVGIKNKWRWEWLQEKDSGGILHVEWCRKLKEVGHCFCFLCGKKLNYANNGKKALLKHAEDSEHQKNCRSQKYVQTLPGAKQQSEKAPLALCDRIANQKAVISCFLSEHSLPFSPAPKLIDLSQALAKDKLALSKLKMERTSATYITTHGVAKTMRDELVAKLNANFFSMNVDEATNNNGEKIINVLVRVFDDDLNRVITAHLGSRKENMASSRNIFLKINQLLEDNDINFSKIVSCLFDNCATMRGSKNGVEKLIRDENMHLLQIDGDLTHKFHNAAKVFFKYFEKFIEEISNNVFYDINESPKAKCLFAELQLLLNFKTVLQILRPIENRFLQMLTICDRLVCIKDALLIYYASFLTDEESKKFEFLLALVFERNRVSEGQKLSIKNIQATIKKQKRSDANQSRKEMILLTLFDQNEKFDCLLNFYCGILPHFNKLVKFFQHDQPNHHLIHAELFDFMRNFLSFFIKPEYLPTNVSDLKDFNLNEDRQLSDKFLNVGAKAYALIKKAQKNKSKWVNNFFTSLREAYVATSKYTIKNFPFHNKCLLYFSALNPKCRKDNSCLTALLNLGEMLPNVIQEEDIGFLLEEIKMYVMDENLVEFSEESRIDSWWAEVFNIKGEGGDSKYRLLTILIKAALSVFSGPLVEGSFNIMDDIIVDDRSSLNIENYEASSLIKFYLKSRQEKSTDFQPNHVMRKNINSARQRYQQCLTAKRELSSSKNPSIQISGNLTEKEIKTADDQTKCISKKVIRCDESTSKGFCPKNNIAPLGVELTATASKSVNIKTDCQNKRKASSPLKEKGIKKVDNQTKFISKKITSFFMKQ